MLERFRKRIEGLHVYVVGRLIQRNHVWLRPHCSAQRQLGLLPLRKRPDRPIANKIFGQPELLEMLDDLTSGNRPLVHPNSLDCNSFIQRLHHTKHTHLPQFRHGFCGVLLHVAQTIPLNLVEDFLSFYMATHQISDLTAMFSILPPHLFAHRSLFLIRWLSQALLQLLVPSVLEADLHVNVRSYLQILFQVPGGVLSDVG
mmetsp:Transcript_45004/g.101943  ORF Transcript_45004/g.101943 Transcript_45004/m.101943 type:complete len:201 (-) Transcript_45004:1327-1929(-)